MTVAIRFQGVSKAYRMRHQRPFLAGAIVAKLRKKPTKEKRFFALRDITFQVARGETVGVIGTNGSGKSTLLSLAAGTSYPTSGTVEVQGRIGPLLELGAGFHPALTGIENIMLNASLLGMSREEVLAKLDDIVEFSGIRDFIDASIQTYSTGMVARLGFAVISHIQPDILLVDETLSVGDADFRKRCLRTMNEFLDRGTTILMVSHDLATLEGFCKRGLWIERGALRADGAAKEVIAAYRNHIAGR